MSSDMSPMEKKKIEERRSPMPPPEPYIRTKTLHDGSEVEVEIRPYKTSREEMKISSSVESLRDTRDPETVWAEESAKRKAQRNGS